MKVLRSELLELFAILDAKTNQYARVNGDDYDLVEDLTQYVNLNETALALEFLADRLYMYNVPLLNHELDLINSLRERIGLESSARFIVLVDLLVR